jgi:hypothetical protein
MIIVGPKNENRKMYVRIHTCTFNFFSLTLFFITNITVANRKTNYNDLRTVSLIGYLFLHTFSYFHSWDLQLSSVCVIHSNGISIQK